MKWTLRGRRRRGGDLTHGGGSTLGGEAGKVVGGRGERKPLRREGEGCG
jgi:hypothetical protein